MRRDAFHQRMSAVNDAFNDEDYDRALSGARALIEEVMEGPIVEAEQMAWPLFYALKSLHAVEDWTGYAAEIERHGAFLVALGPKNHAYACSLMVESLYRARAPEAMPRWGAECCYLRIRDEDYDSLNMAIRMTRGLLRELGRVDLEVAFLERLITVGIDSELTQLAVYAQRWALAAAAEGDGEPLLQDARRRLVARLPALRELALDSSSGVVSLLVSLAREPWFYALLPAAECRSLELATSLFEPASEGDLAAVAALLGEAGDVNVRDAVGRTPLGVAAFAGHAPLVGWLLAREGVDPNLANLQRRTPLMQAADQGHHEIVEQLLAAGADIDAVDLNEQSALILASWQDHLETARALLRAGASAELRDRAGNSALSLAATQDVPEVITALIEGGAAIDGVTPLGHTALMKAAMEGMTRNLEVLLARGADTALRDQHGMTALRWAEQEGHEEAAALLRAREPR